MNYETNIFLFFNQKYELCKLQQLICEMLDVNVKKVERNKLNIKCTRVVKLCKIGVFLLFLLLHFFHSSSFSFSKDPSRRIFEFCIFRRKIFLYCFTWTNNIYNKQNMNKRRMMPTLEFLLLLQPFQLKTFK